MKTRTIALVGAAALLGTTALATASEWHGWGGDRGWGHAMHGRMGHMERMLETFDSNGDGRLSQAEIDRARADRLAAFDANGDGALSLDEFQALWLDAMRERMVDRFQALDADGDGSVTKAEFARPFAHLVRRMDRNDDAALGPADMRRRHRGHDDQNGGDNDSDD